MSPNEAYASEFERAAYIANDKDKVALYQRIVELEAENSNLEDKVSDLEDELAEEQSSLSAKEDEITNLEGTVSELRFELSETLHERINVDLALEAVCNELATLKSNIRNLL